MASKPVTRDDLVAEARRWLGTPFRWQASVRGVGCDCKGLLAGIARELHMPEARSLAAMAHSYPHNFNPDELLTGLRETLRETDNPKAGDVIAIEIGTVPGPRHLGILTGDGRMIHCYGNGPSQVISAPVGRHRKVHSFWTWPSLGETDEH